MLATTRHCAPGLRLPMCTIGGIRIGASRRPLLVQAVRVPRPRRASATAKPPTAPTAAEAPLFVAEEVVGTEVEVMAPGAVDAGLFEADLSATALLAQLEEWTEKLGDVLDAPPAAGTLAGLAAKDAAGDMTRGEHGMFNTNVRGGRMRRRAWVAPGMYGCMDGWGEGECFAVGLQAWRLPHEHNPWQGSATRHAGCGQRRLVTSMRHMAAGQLCRGC